MPIVSVSLNQKILDEIDVLQEEMGFSGRSETIRAAVRMLIADKKDKDDLFGVVDATLLVIHDEDSSDIVSKIRHDFQELVIAWPAVYIDGWSPLDPTFGQELADATHIKILEGGFERQADLLRVVGRMRVTVLEKSRMMENRP